MRGIVVVLGLCLLVRGLEGDVFRMESQPESPLLIELYTSEGCSSCPPAEKWLGGFLSDPELWTKKVPVAFHVDYWDRLGWKDKYATHENTLRQYRLRDEGAVRSIYTPGFVVDGREWRGWFEGKSIDEIHSDKRTGKLVVEVDSGKIMATYSGGEVDALLNIAILGVDLKSKVSKGENRGRLLNHNFVALEHRELPFTDGKVEFALPAFELGTASRFGIAVWVVSPGDTHPEVVIGNWLPSKFLSRK